MLNVSTADLDGNELFSSNTMLYFGFVDRVNEERLDRCLRQLGPRYGPALSRHGDRDTHLTIVLPIIIRSEFQKKMRL